MQNPKFWFKYIAYHLRWNKFTIAVVERIRSMTEHFNISKRLSKKDYTEQRRYEIMIRFFEMKSFRIKMESKYASRALSQFIADLSAATGVPQWELRAKIQSDYDIDI